MYIARSKKKRTPRNMKAHPMVFLVSARWEDVNCVRTCDTEDCANLLRVGEPHRRHLDAGLVVAEAM